MQSSIVAGDEVVARYFETFVNRRFYTIQSARPKPNSTRHWFYRPKDKDKTPLFLSLGTIRRHLEGTVTIGLYAINPNTQRCKWVAIDADYPDALEDLLKLQWELRQDGVEAALENSRRGGHLWLFADMPLLAKDCRIYIFNLAKRLKVPVKGAGLADGIELFPKQDGVPADEFGNALRGPLGIHRGAGKRYWFYGADYTLEDQMNYLSRLKRITEDEMKRFVTGLEMPEELVPKPRVEPAYYQRSGSSGREFLRYRRRLSRDPVVGVDDDLLRLRAVWRSGVVRAEEDLILGPGLPEARALDRDVVQDDVARDQERPLRDPHRAGRGDADARRFPAETGEAQRGSPRAEPTHDRSHLRGHDACCTGSQRLGIGPAPGE